MNKSALGIGIKFLGLVLLVCGCRREPEFTEPDLVDQNAVRPEAVTQPLPGATNATNADVTNASGR